MDLKATTLHRPGPAGADKRAYTAYAESETHEGFEVVDVDFGVPQPSGGEERQDADEPGARVR